MFKENYEKICSTKEKQFNNFLNKTIILNSKDFYKRQKTNDERELNILDDENFEKELYKYIEEPETLSFENNAIDFIDFINDEDLCVALKSLSNIEQMVIFLMFKKQLKQDEAAKILNICSKSVSRINKRAIEKIKKFLKEDF